MRGLMVWSASTQAVVALTLLVRFSRCDAVYCKCRYHGNGCAISIAAPQGFKCQCLLNSPSTCRSLSLPCSKGEHCPGNIAHYCACLQGGGNCKGHTSPLHLYPISKAMNICKKYENTINTGVVGQASCKCNYRYGRGCYITDPAPLGWRCHCQVFEMIRLITDVVPFFGLPVCIGWAEQCVESGDCLGNDKSYCECQRGSGDCNGYRIKSENCPMFCNCNSAHDWPKGSYTIEQVLYKTNESDVRKLKPFILAEKDITNYSGQRQVITTSIQETLSQTYSYKQTGGFEIQTGLEFKASVPFIYETSGSLRIATSMLHTTGKSMTHETTFTGQFTCNGGPRRHTKCTVIIHRGNVSVPYTMLVKHNVIHDCICENYGIWTGILVYNTKLISKELGECSNESCGDF